MKFVAFIFLFLILFGCQRQPQTVAKKAEKKVARPAPLNKFADATLRRIYTWQDERKTQALLPYLKHELPLYRQQAALALASVQAKETVPDLLLLLTDKEATVRQAAAYALGQVGDASAEEGLVKAATTEKTATVYAEIAEAIGKCATQKGLDFLTGFTLTNDIEKAGQAWGIYRTNAKNLNYKTAIRKTIHFLAAGNIQPVRLAAAHFLARTPNLDLKPYLLPLITSAEKDTSPEVRMASATALAKVKDPKVIKALVQLVNQDPDYRVQVNAIKALRGVDYELVKEIIYTALGANNHPAALTAAEYLLAQAPPEEADQLLKLAQRAAHWRVRATLLAAALKTEPNKEPVREMIKQRYQQSPNIYEKGALLGALANDIQAYDFIQQATFTDSTKVLATYGIQALADMRRRKDFPDSLKPTFAAIFRKAVESGDVALIGITADLLQSPELDFKEAYPDWTFIKTARDTLVLPRDMETYQALEKTIRFFQGLPETTPPQNPFTHPINWDLVQTLKPQQKILIQTVKGTVELQLFTEEAPGTVANFVQLARSGFLTGKNFHRVVPNFVVQGGDPRGDGWGGTDYAIRSELANLRYGEGFVGMASAGKDTESCQWFITHSPTPHLDGRYTIFAKVISGMPVVHQLEIGDKIEAVTIVK